MSLFSGINKVARFQNNPGKIYKNEGAHLSAPTKTTLGQQDFYKESLQDHEVRCDKREVNIPLGQDAWVGHQIY